MSSKDKNKDSEGISKKDIDDYQRRLDDLTKLAKGDIQWGFSTIVNANFLTKEQKIDRLERYYKHVIKQWGDMACELATTLYEDATGKIAKYGDNVSDKQLEKAFDYADFESKPQKEALNTLQEKTSRFIREGANNTIIQNAKRDKITYARVPRGKYTCAFCCMLASRGFVYANKETAGELNKFHNHCDCMIVPSTKGYIKDYNPDDLYAKYQNDIVAHTSENGKVSYVWKGGINPQYGAGSIKDEFIRNSTPGSGRIVTQEGAEVSKEEQETAEWLLENFGGTIEHLARILIPQGVKTPDYKWNGELWDLKQGANIKTIEARIAKASAQTDGYGVILDITNNKTRLRDIKKEVMKNMDDFKLTHAIIKKGNNVVDILRLK
jgi:hypothetical protein